MEINALIVSDRVILSQQAAGHYPASLLGVIKAITEKFGYLRSRAIWFCAGNAQTRKRMLQLGVRPGQTYRISGKLVNTREQENHIVFHHIEKNSDYFKGYITLCDSHTPF